MLDAETLRTIREMPVKERIVLIMAIMASLDAPQVDALQIETLQSTFFSLIDSWQSQTGEIQTPLEHWKTSVLRCLQQTNTSQQTKRPPFGFMKGTGAIHGDIISPAVPESDWGVLQ